jgi:hypothetical protein
VGALGRLAAGQTRPAVSLLAGWGLGGLLLLGGMLVSPLLGLLLAAGLVVYGTGTVLANLVERRPAPEPEPEERRRRTDHGVEQEATVESEEPRVLASLPILTREPAGTTN